MNSGFKLQRRMARLSFVGNQALEGAEVVVRINVPLADVLSLQEYSESQDAKDRLEMLRLFSEKVLVSWNLEDEAGQPIPAQPDGMTKLPAEESALIIAGWAEALGQVPVPLGARLPNGDTSPEASVMTGVS